MDTPRNIDQARRQISRTERAKEIIEAGYTFSFDDEADTVAVCKPGRLAADYFILDGKCDCQDFQNHGDFCKHTLAAGLVQEEARAEAQAAAYDAEMEKFGEVLIDALLPNL